jgi:hypothetical protein
MSLGRWFPGLGRSPLFAGEALLGEYVKFVARPTTPAWELSPVGPHIQKAKPQNREYFCC